MSIYPQIPAGSNEEFLLELLKALYEDLEEKRKIRNLNHAGFIIIKELEGYDFSKIQFPNALSKQMLQELSFLGKKENLIFYGSVATGKTHLSIALGVKAIRDGKNVVFYRVHNLIRSLESKDTRKLKKKYTKNTTSKFTNLG